MAELTATFAAQFDAFTAACAKAEVSLKRISSGADAVGERLTNMSNSLTGVKIIQQATIMAEAVERVGGVSTLTAKELTRVGATATEAAAKLEALGQDVPAGIQKIADAAKALADETAKAAKPTDALGVSFGKLVASYVTAQSLMGVVSSAFHAVTDSITGSIKAAGDAEKSHQQLVAALRAQGTAMPSVIKAYSDYATALQNTTIYQDDALEGAAALLAEVGNVMPRDMQKALKATTDLASGLGKDLNEAALLVSKAAEGNTGALKKAGVEIDATKAKAEGFGYVLDQITAKFGGQAEALASTYQGRLAQLGNTWNNVEESIGRVITQNATVLAAFDHLNNAIAGNTREFTGNQAVMNTVSDAVILLVRGVGTLGPMLALMTRTLGTVATGWTSLYNVAINFSGALDNAAIHVLKYLQVVARLQGQQISFANEIKFFQDDMKELNARYDTNAQTGAALQAMSQKIADGFKDAGQFADQLAADLEATRGRTIALTESARENQAAWDRHTTAMQNGAKAAEEAAAAEKKLEELTGKATGAKLAADLDLWSQALDRISAKGQSLTWASFTDLIKLINEAKAAGVPLTAQLEEMWVSYTRLHSPIAALFEPLDKLLKAFPDLSGAMKENERGAEDFSKGVESQSKGLEKLSVPIGTLLRAFPQYKLTLDSTTVATMAVAAAHTQLSPALLKDVDALIATTGSLDKAIAKLKEYNSITVEQEAAIRAHYAAVKTLDQSLTELSSAFQTLSQISGGSFGGLTKGIGTAVADVNLMSKSFAALKTAAADWSKEAVHTASSFANLAVSAASAAVSVVGLFAAGVNLVKTLIDDAVAAQNLADALGIADQAGRDFLLLQQDMSGGFQYGGNVAFAFSDQLVAAMKKSKDALESFYIIKTGSPALVQSYVEALNLAGIIREIGGVSDQNIGHLEALMTNLFDIIKLGGPTAGQAVNALNDALKEMGPYLSTAGTLWDSTLQGAISHAKELGLHLKAIDDLMAGQQSNLEQAIGGVTGKLGGEAKTMLDLQKTVKEAQTAYDDLVASGASQDQITKAAKDLATAQAAVGHATVTTQAEFDRLNRIALATFNTLVASGKSPVEAMQAIGGSIDDLIAGAQAFGLGSTEAFDTLVRWRDLTKANEPLLNQISSLNNLMTASANLGGLTASGFADMQAQGVAAYDQLTAAGFTQQEAETAEKPLLESIIKLHKDKGLAIDEATQKIIDQATQDGVLGAQEESTNDVLREGLGALITVLGGDLPEAWRKTTQAGTDAAAIITGANGLDKVNKELDIQKKALSDDKAWQDLQKNAAAASGDVTNSIKKIPTTVNVGVNYTTSGSTTPPGPTPGPTPNPASRGGLVTATGIEYLQGGGAVWPWMPQGTDTVPAMLTPGERVLSVAEARRYRAGGGGGGTVMVMLDGRLLAQAVVPEFEGAVRRLGFAR